MPLRFQHLPPSDLPDLTNTLKWISSPTPMPSKSKLTALTHPHTNQMVTHLPLRSNILLNPHPFTSGTFAVLESYTKQVCNRCIQIDSVLSIICRIIYKLSLISHTEVHHKFPSSTFTQHYQQHNNKLIKHALPLHSLSR